MNCQERKDSILLYAAGALDAADEVELRAHLETGCPQCAGSLAEAEALLAQLPLALPRQQPSSELKQRLMGRIAAETRRPLRIPAARQRWDRIVLPASIAALLAVAILLAVRTRSQAPTAIAPDPREAMIAALQKVLNERDGEIAQRDAKLVELQKQIAGLDSMKFAELKGAAQPGAQGRVFIDLDKSQWYFFTSGMKPAGQGKTYELWLIADNKKTPAGTFNVNENGSATLLGKVPALPKDSAVTLAVTDEPGQGGPIPLGTPQIVGTVRN